MRAQEEKEILPPLALLPHRHVIEMRVRHPRVFLVLMCLRSVTKKSAGCLSLVSWNFLMPR